MSKKIFSVLLMVALMSIYVYSQQRNALLIANGNYANFSSLKNPVPEANALANSLRQLGFNVTVKTNLSLDQMQSCLEEFEAKVRRSGGVAFFHYGGHAVQVGGINYLIPADADIESERRVKARALDLDEVMSSMQGDTNIVILDACRNNPLPAGKGRSATRGLQPISNKPKNSVIVYSAQAGSVAVDGVFTPVLTKKILEAKSFTRIIREVRKEVSDQTNNKQSPGSYDELYDEIFLAGHNPNQSVETPTVAKVTTTTTTVRRVAADFVYVESGSTYIFDTNTTISVSSFYICDHEVTQKEYSSVMGNNPVSGYDRGENKPVENVSWYDALKYCNALSTREGLTPCYAKDSSNKWTWDRNANGYRLPTENEWEWAARGGKQSKGYKYSGSNNLSDVAWYSDNSKYLAHNVKTKQSNELGIYDMSGNVGEWCWDWYGNSRPNTKDYAGPSSGDCRVARGGRHIDEQGRADRCSVSYRGYNDPLSTNFVNGFRVVRSVK